ncbi:hypothetical protein AZ78_2794 [Lysobacter capsici AZ78]|uniref:Uncharacterized protein n=1 Tax=Lysobacter capsici AZ78 TaxID=1444315 RepID=A0A120AGX2_9GAMM|nr:hypothetical protein AZ78_2794 [Lysobacter capsici AZ78]
MSQAFRWRCCDGAGAGDRWLGLRLRSLNVAASLDHFDASDASMIHGYRDREHRYR